jgi:hypothetical protein
MLDAHRETLVIMFMIERRQREEVDVFRDTVGSGRAIPTCLMGCLADCASAVESEYGPPISTLGYATTLS